MRLWWHKYFDEGDGGGTKDWREQAKDSGYDVLPVADAKELRDGVQALKDFRAGLPEEFAGKEGDFLTAAADSIKKLEELENKDKSELEQVQAKLDTSTKEVASLKGQLTKSNNRAGTLDTEVQGLYKGMDLKIVQQARNVAVHPTFVTDDLFGSVSRKDYDLDSEQGTKDYHTALWEKVLKPASDAQAEVTGNVRPANQAPDNQNVNGDPNRDRGSEKQAVDTLRGGFGAHA